MNRVRVTALLLLFAAAARAEDAKPSAHPIASAPQQGSATPDAPASASTAQPLRVRSSGGDGALFALDLIVNLFSLAADVALLEDSFPRAAPAQGEALAVRSYDPEPDDSEDPPPSWRDRRRGRRHDARHGFLFSFGVGGSGLRASPDRTTGAFDFGLRMGYGFNDRFQFFGDFSLDGAQYADGRTVSSWTLTARGQTVLIGDRDGNGLNLNAGFGLGGVSRGIANSCDGGYGGCYDSGQASSPTGLALAGGLSYDARIGRSFSLSPEFFATWHQVPNGAGRANDIASAVGVRINFLWYLY